MSKKKFEPKWVKKYIDEPVDLVPAEGQAVFNLTIFPEGSFGPSRRLEDIPLAKLAAAAGFVEPDDVFDDITNLRLEYQTADGAYIKVTMRRIQ